MNIKNYVFQTIKDLTKKGFNEASKIKEIGIDSLDLVEVIVAFEKKFKIAIPDFELEKVQTVADVIALLQKYLK